ncbi:hypothetical protein FRB91_002285 [Serendipita sp. 411]|nr:hypothetical protein FRB91_002285 [Serendipita sp. 411]
MRERREAWELYERGQTEQAETLFEGRSMITHWELWRSVLRMFRNRNVEFLVAPYTAAAQLVYLMRHQKAYINAIYSSNDILIFPSVDKIITSISFDAKPQPTFTFVSKRSIISDLASTLPSIPNMPQSNAISDDLFMDSAILAGVEHISIFPPLATPEVVTFPKTVELVRHYKTGHACVMAFNEDPRVKVPGTAPTSTSQYADQFMRTRAMYKYSLILSSDGTVQPLPLAVPAPAPAAGNSFNLTAADIPQDLHEVFTHRLPDEIYFYLSRGLLSPHALIWLTSGMVVEKPPLCNGETSDYRRFIKEVITESVTGPRAMTLALISSVIHTFWTSRRVIGVFWFDQNSQVPGTPGPGQNQNKGIPHMSRETTQAVERITSWLVPTSIIEDELRLQMSSTIDFALCLGATSNGQRAGRTRNKSKFLERKDEVVANVIWRFLDLRGFLAPDHSHAPLARAMYAALKQSRTNDKFQDPLFLFLELIRAGVLHWNLWGGRPYSGGPSFGDDDEKKCMLLVMRVISLVPLNTKPQPWTAPLSRELLAFNSFARALSRSLRTLVETTALNLLLRGDANRAREDLLDIAMALPFQNDTNTGFGILAKVYLDALHAIYEERIVSRDDPGVFEAKESAMECVDDTFEGVRGPRTEVERGFRFWDAALCAVRQMHADNQISPELADAFESAQSWLEPRRP